MCFRYHLSTQDEPHLLDHGKRLPTELLSNPYRQGAMFLSREILASCGETIDVYTRGISSSACNLFSLRVRPAAE